MMTITLEMCTRVMIRFIRDLGVESGTQEITPWKSDTRSEAGFYQKHVDVEIDQGTFSKQDFVDDFAEHTLLPAARALVDHLPRKMLNTFVLPFPEKGFKQVVRHSFDGISIRAMLADTVGQEKEYPLDPPKEVLRFDIAYRAAA